MTRTITAQAVAELRARTSAGMMDCKRALEEAAGDPVRAAELLRARGIAKAETRAGRPASQGLVAGTVDERHGVGALLELNCETDFVARTDAFRRAAAVLVDRLAEARPPSLDVFLEMAVDPDITKTVAERVKEVSGATGETVTLRQVVAFAHGPAGALGLYLHHNRQVGVLVELTCGTPEAARSDAVRELAREMAIHIASANPLAVRGEEIPLTVVERERRIATEQAAGEGKPEAIRTKMIEGKIRKFMKEQALLEQPWVKDNQRTIGQLVQGAAAQAGAPVTVTRFARLQVGVS